MLGETHENHKNLIHISQSVDQQLNLGHPKYKVGESHIQQMYGTMPQYTFPSGSCCKEDIKLRSELTNI
jgi:hypothetical protein